MSPLAARFARGSTNLHDWFLQERFRYSPLGSSSTSVRLRYVISPLHGKDEPPSLLAFWLQNKTRTVKQPSELFPPSLPTWATQTTGSWTMTSPLLLRPGSPGARRCCSPWRGSPSRDRPCALSASSCCCCSSSSSAASGSCWTPTAACPHHRGRTTRRDWTEDSLIMRWCKDEGWAWRGGGWTCGGSRGTFDWWHLPAWRQETPPDSTFELWVKTRSRTKREKEAETSEVPASISNLQQERLPQGGNHQYVYHVIILVIL